MSNPTYTIPDEFSRLRILLERMDFDYMASRGLKEFLHGREDYSEITSAIKRCAATDRERTKEICDELIPKEHRNTYDRFITGEIVDITSPFIREKLIAQHSQTVLDVAHEIIHGETYPRGMILATIYTRSETPRLQVRRWVSETRAYSDQARFDVDILLAQTQDRIVVATLDQKLHYPAEPTIENDNRKIVSLPQSQRRAEFGFGL